MKIRITLTIIIILVLILTLLSNNLFATPDRIRTPLLIFESVITIVLVAFFSISNLKKNKK